MTCQRRSQHAMRSCCVSHHRLSTNFVVGVRGVHILCLLFILDPCYTSNHHVNFSSNVQSFSSHVSCPRVAQRGKQGHTTRTTQHCECLYVDVFRSIICSFMVLSDIILNSPHTRSLAQCFSGARDIILRSFIRVMVTRSQSIDATSITSEVVSTNFSFDWSSLPFSFISYSHPLNPELRTVSHMFVLILGDQQSWSGGGASDRRGTYLGKSGRISWFSFRIHNPTRPPFWLYFPPLLAPL